MDLFDRSLIYRQFVRCINSFIYLFTKRLYIKAWVDIRYGKVLPNNWGDDINIYLLELISKKRIAVCNCSLLHNIFIPSHYICIGSILGWYENSKSEIWGAGFISEDSKLNFIPKKIHSVRGKLTRRKLLEMGIDCPESYGDPALLLSKFYQPNVKRRYKIGIVPHFTDFDNEIVDDFISKNVDSIKIRLKGYKKWTDIVDQICSCDLILSSSLHGLIVSDSYGIPNVWINLSDNVFGGDFKFLDYFSSVRRKEVVPYNIANLDDLEFIVNKSENIKNTANVNFDLIFKSCPFYLK